MTIPLESQKIADALNKILDQTDTSKIVNSAVQLTKAVSEKQEGLYKNIGQYVNKHSAETANELNSGIEKAVDNKTQISETLADSAKQFERSAPTETSNRYKEQIRPQAPSR